MGTTISQSIVLGVVSGVLTSAFLWMLVELFQMVVIPWYQKIIYQGVLIEGVWNGYYEGEADAAYTVHLKQRAHAVTGEIAMHRQPNGQEYKKDFTCTGKFRDNQLNLSYEAKDKGRLGTGAYVMKLVDDGMRLEGQCLYLSANRNEVVSVTEHWVKSV